MLHRLAFLCLFAPAAALAATPVDPALFRTWSGSVQFVATPYGSTVPTLQKVVTMSLTIDDQMRVAGSVPDMGCAISGLAVATASNYSAGHVYLDVTLTGCSSTGFNGRYSDDSDYAALRKTETVIDTGLAHRGGCCSPGSMNYEIKGALRPATSSASFTPTPGMWWSPTESGTGYNIQAAHGTLVMTVYSYNADGSPQWFLTSGPLTLDGRTYVGTLDKYRDGQCISCAYSGRPSADGVAGPVMIRFFDESRAQIMLPGNRVVEIVPYAF